MNNEERKNKKVKEIAYSKELKKKNRLQDDLRKAVSHYDGSYESLEQLDKIASKIELLNFKKSLEEIYKEDRFEKFLNESPHNEGSRLEEQSGRSFKQENKQEKFKKSPSLIDMSSIQAIKFNNFVQFNESIKEEAEEQVVEDRIEEIRELLRSNSVVLVQGNTGCGKTTKIPRLLMDEYENIVCTQPRRLAAINVARKVAADLQCNVGGTIGYSIRFEDVTSEQTKLKFVTDGVLIKEIVSADHKKKDKIAGYDLIIIDEAHERSINIDYLLGYVKQALSRHECKTKLLIMSATINSEKFATYYNCPVIKIKHKIFPLDYFYLMEDTEDYLDESIRTAVQIAETEKSGDILVFLTGQDEIEKAYLALTCALENKDITILKLYSSMPPEEQDLVFTKKERKIVLATNIAETSITVENVQFVIDSGKFKSKNFAGSVEFLEVLDVSAAQADQRAGRAGRTRAGEVYRLYTREKYMAFDKNPVPEILRSSLTSVILSMKSLGINDVVDFDYLDKPSVQSINRAQETLYYLRAIDAHGYITKIGRKISKLPLCPEMATSLYVAEKVGCLNSVATIAAFLEYQTPFQDIRNDHPLFRRFKAVTQAFADPKGDFYSYLRIYNTWEREKFSYGFLKNNFLKPNAMMQIRNIRSQILRYFDLSTDSSLRIEEAFSSGFFMNVTRIDDHCYRTIFDGIRCSIHPKDGLCKSYPRYLIFFELFGAKARFIRHCLEIDPSILQLCVNHGLNTGKAK